MTSDTDASVGTVPFYARRFVAGTCLSQTLDKVKELNSKNLTIIYDILGENVTSLTEATQATDDYLHLIDTIVEQKLNAYVSLKLTQFGLDLSEDECFKNLCKVCEKADAVGMRVAMDMEGSVYTERTLALYEEAAKKYKSPELVLQAYLYRTDLDLGRVLAANGCLRLCKGAYKEPADKAFQDKKQLFSNYIKLLERSLLSAKHVGIATHDDAIWKWTKEFLAQQNIPKERYEFQMLYGMRQDTAIQLAQDGYNVSVYMPYGKDWKAYFSRRIAERKENLFFVMKNFFKS